MTAERRARIGQMHRAGASANEIAATTGASHADVQRVAQPGVPVVETGQRMSAAPRAQVMAASATPDHIVAEINRNVGGSA